MHPVVDEFKRNAEKTIFQLKEDIRAIRTGRASPSFVESLPVTTYGGQTTLKLLEIATIATEGPNALVIVPFDPSVVSDIEKAIFKSSLGLSPSVQGTKILVKIPPLSQEQREKLMKLISQMIEEKKVIIRGHRDDARRKIKLAQEKKEITEDGKFRLEKEIDTKAQSSMEEIQTVKENKEKEIMEI